MYLSEKKNENTKLKIYMHPHVYCGFPESSVGKESICNAGDPGSIPESGRPAGEGIGYPLQYSWALLRRTGVGYALSRPLEVMHEGFQSH